MVDERMRDVYILQGVSPFAWGPDADLWGLRATAYGCCAFTVPATWIQTINAHSALEQFFMEQFAQLPAADFTRCYTDQELHTAIRGIQRRDRERSHHSRGA
jgi:hypothetical protein